MNSEELARERIEDEASVWAARLHSGSMTAPERARLDDWLAASDEHRAVLAHYRELTATLDVGLARARARRESPRRRWWVAGAAGLAAAAAAAAILLGVFHARPEAIVTDTAERRSIALADGTRVELNARTELVLDLGPRERHVRLIRGEGLFAVAPDPSRPFVVETAGGNVQVTGTVFDVRCGSARQLEVIVLEGHVRVSPLGGTAAATLEPNAQGIVSGDRVTVRALSETAARAAVAWCEGQAVFEDTPLGEALARFAAYDPRRIEVGAAAANLRIGGRYSLADLDGALDSIERTLPVRIVRERDAVRIDVSPQ